jgi:hypothetical protein
MGIGSEGLCLNCMPRNVNVNIKTSRHKNALSCARPIPSSLFVGCLPGFSRQKLGRPLRVALAVDVRLPLRHAAARRVAHLASKVKKINITRRVMTATNLANKRRVHQPALWHRLRRRRPPVASRQIPEHWHDNGRAARVAGVHEAALFEQECQCNAAVHAASVSLVSQGLKG